MKATIQKRAVILKDENNVEHVMAFTSQLINQNIQEGIKYASTLYSANLYDANTPINDIKQDIQLAVNNRIAVLSNSNSWDELNWIGSLHGFRLIPVTVTYECDDL